MVEFEKYLASDELQKETDPIKIFDDLNKETGKEELWTDQKSILAEWYTKNQDKRDLIVKLPTGRGKTLIGLLILQSLLNNDEGPALYLCPNNYLVNQTIRLAESFGIRTTKFEEANKSIPIDFVNNEAILVTTCQKLINGKSKFGIKGISREPQVIGAIVIDDAHKCQEIIREAFSIIIDSNYELYSELLALFEESLKKQDIVSYNDITRNIDEAILAVPYWNWTDNLTSVLKIISKHYDEIAKKSERNESENKIFFTWNLIKKHLPYSTCIFSGRKMEIIPRLLPLDLIPSFTDSKHRIYLTATLADDTFLIKDFNIPPNDVEYPLICTEKKYSGERLIIIPSLIDNSLDRKTIINWLSNYVQKGKDFGVFALVNSSHKAKDWKSPDVATVKNLEPKISKLTQEIEKNSVRNVYVLVNGYDGVDLPDRTCRILCMDSLPAYTSLYERYVEKNLHKTKIYRKLMSQRIEQGLGRSIRGSNDWSVDLIIGTDLTNFISDKSKRTDLSDEVRKQIEISDILLPDLKKENASIVAMEKLIKQFIDRDENWRRFYKKYMVNIKPKSIDKGDLNRFVIERESELLFQRKQYSEASEKIQKIIDICSDDPEELGWYLQLKALYLAPFDKSKSIDCQVKAYLNNPNTFSRSEGISYSKLLTKNFNREITIINWIKTHDNFNTMIVDVDRILDVLNFNTSHEIFEEGIKQIGEILGFGSQRPEKETKHVGAPDNLWELKSHYYWVIECKNEVIANRGVCQTENGQMMNSMGWFEEKYSDSETYLPVMIHPSNYLEPGSHPLERVKVLTPENLDKMKANVKAFFLSLKDYSFEKLTDEIIRKNLADNKLSHTQLEGEYLQNLKRNN